MITNLMQLPPMPEVDKSIKLKRAMAADKKVILDFVRTHFEEGWAGEAECALFSTPSKCFIATKEGVLVGFACYDATARGYFGPIGVLSSERGTGVGTALMIKTLEAMRDYGYVYGIIGWVDDAAQFYKKCLGAEFIKGGEIENTIYSQLVWMK